MSKEQTENLPTHHVYKAHGDLQLADEVRAVHHLWAPPGSTLEQATNIRSFAHIAHNLRPNGEIIIRAEDGTFYARVLVLAVRNYDVKVMVLEHIKLKGDASIAVDSEYDVSYINGRYKWGFKRKGASDWIIKELATEQEAQAALADHRKAIAA